MKVRPFITGATAAALGALLLLAGAPTEALASAEAVSPPTISQALALYGASPLAGELGECAASAVRLGADPAALADFIAGAGADNRPDRDLLALLRRAERLAGLRLPVEPVLSRYRQGFAKGIPFARIETVVDGLEARLMEAARYLDETLSAPADHEGQRARLTAIDHGAYALGVGVPGGTVERAIRLAVHERRPVDAAQAPVLALGVMAASGVRPEKCWEVVDAAWRNGYRGEDLERLGRAIGRLSRNGQGAPPEVIDQVLAEIVGHAGRDRLFEGLDALCGEGSGREGAPGMGTGQDPARDRPGPGPGRDQGNGPHDQDGHSAKNSSNPDPF